MTIQTSYQQLTGNPPFPWQLALYDRFSNGEMPSTCNVPTGLGKTAVIPIWLLALAKAPKQVPRRLVYVVNRRTVVDQATREAEKIRRRIDDLKALRQRLENLCSLPCQTPLAISTLRGQFADNAEWRLDPARPAIIVGTVDMIGSRLLFEGYRCGYKSRPLHAGFLGQDVLLVHDEAHLEPAFQELLTAIQAEQKRSREFGRFHVMELSATSRSAGDALELTREDRDDPTVRKRLKAKKEIRLHACDDDNRVADPIIELALSHRESDQAILVFVRRVEDAEKIAKRLPKDSTRQLTGTMRGLERDSLVRDPVFQRFMPQSDRPEDAEPPQKGTVWLICTSAGEVGVNLSADNLICDLSPFDSMTQRFGRVNRFGEGSAIIDIVHPQKFEDNPLDERRKLTLSLLEQLDGDASSAAISKIPPDDRLAAFTPLPQILPTSDILFDSWALTTIRDRLPGRPPVADYIHGIADWQPPETYVAWRTEVDWISDELLTANPPEELLADYPLKPQELLRDRYDRVFKHLQRLADAHPDAPVWIIADDKITSAKLSELAESDKESIADKTILLPPSVGGLSLGGTLNDEPTRPGLDVADEAFENENRTSRRRVRLMADDEDLDEMTNGMRLIRKIILSDGSDEDESDEEPQRREWLWFVRPASADDDGSATARAKQLLEDHNPAVGQIASKFAVARQLDETIRSALEFAGSHHDDGKDRKIWQLSIGNRTQEIWAKSGNRRPPEVRIDYRHEFGSLLDVVELPDFKALSSEAQDLALHLIAAHHGRARPHFPVTEVYDPNHSDQAAAHLANEVPRRFARLQRKYGRWGLAYLESLLRAADALASAGIETDDDTDDTSDDSK